MRITTARLEGWLCYTNLQKGSRCQVDNYRPVSLNSVICKVITQSGVFMLATLA